MKTTKIKRKFDGVDYDIELTPDELERAYRTQEEKYRREDAELHLAPYIESGDIPENSITDVVLEELVDWFFDFFDCNIPENDIWDRVIEEYFFWDRDKKLTDNTDADPMSVIQNVYQTLVNSNDISKITCISLSNKLGRILDRNGVDCFDRKLKNAIEALDREDTDEAVGFLGEILCD